MLRSSLLFSGVALWVSLSSCDPDSLDPEVHPNILVIVADDMGTQAGLYGDNVAVTPHLDSLARHFAVFQNAYVTQASCSPSRASLHTGLYPHQHGMYGLQHASTDFALSEQVHLLPEIMQEAGYFTGWMGKVHVRPVERFTTDWITEQPTSLRNPITWGREAGKFFKRAGNRSFFLTVNFYDPHVDEPSQEFVGQIDGYPAQPLGPYDVNPWPFQGIDTYEQRQRIADYYNSITRFDRGVGEILKALEDEGLLETTAVFILSDHGAPFLRGKTSCYEAGVQIPMLAYLPTENFRQGRRQGFVSTVDLYPTLLELAGLGNDGQSTTGRSLVPVLEGRSAQVRERLFTEFNYHRGNLYYPRRAVRQGDMKLIHNLIGTQQNPIRIIDYDRAFAVSQEAPYVDTEVGALFRQYLRPGEFELYNLAEDPYELHNLIDEPAYQTLRAELEAQLRTWQARTSDPWLED